MEKITFVNNSAPALNATNLNQLQTNVENDIGLLSNLTTTAKTNLVAAINEAASTGGSGNDVYIGTTEPSSEDVKLWVNPSEDYANVVTEVVNSLDGDQTTLAPSVHAVKTANTYSTTEVKTGETWVDGRPIYRKVLNVENLPNNTAKNISTGLSSSSVLPIFLKGYALKTTGEYACMPLPFFTNTNPVYIGYLNSNSIWNIVVTTTSDRSNFNGYITIEYIKTTD